MRSAAAGALRLWRQAPLLLEDAVAQLIANFRVYALTMTGIVWGAAGLILMLSVGAAFDRFLDVGAASSGDRWTRVDPDFVREGVRGERLGDALRFDREDLAQLRGLALASRVAGQVVELAVVESELRSRSTVVVASSPESAEIENHRLARGRFYAQRDDAQDRPVVVLGSALAVRLFGAEDAVGRWLKINDQSFQVVGVLRSKGMQLISFGDVHDNMAFVPLSAAEEVLGSDAKVAHILVDPLLKRETRVMQDEIRALLLQRRGLGAESGGLSFKSVVQIMAPFDRIALALQVLLGLIGTSTLCMAGMGVGNLMVAVVNSRRREFGMRRSCGARASDVTLQILIEGVVVVVAGGVAGIVLGWLLVLGMGLLPLPDALPRPALVPSVLVTTFVVLVCVGIGAGVVPARIASRVDPSAALRS